MFERLLGAEEVAAEHEHVAERRVHRGGRDRRASRAGSRRAARCAARGQSPAFASATAYATRALPNAGASSTAARERLLRRLEVAGRRAPACRARSSDARPRDTQSSSSSENRADASSPLAFGLVRCGWRGGAWPGAARRRRCAGGRRRGLGARSRLAGRPAADRQAARGRRRSARRRRGCGAWPAARRCCSVVSTTRTPAAGRGSSAACCIG